MKPELQVLDLKFEVKAGLMPHVCNKSARQRTELLSGLRREIMLTGGNL